MNILSNIFNRNKIDCPRCLGKGHVDLNDIKRLNKELKWGPGECAYCNGKGKINPKIQNKIPVDTTYLTTDLSKQERKKLINNDKQALIKGLVSEKKADDLIKQVEFLHFEGKLNPDKIVELFLIPQNAISSTEKQELLDYILRIIEHKK